ncbi:MAG: acetate--CoA ligase [Candidatus Lambdaproteobacteria bacterium]|nr:acetate--CoA ligase [Candidatus Lambdaproteobacteria bacterium]
MSEQLFPVPSDFPRTGTLDETAYKQMYRESVEKPEAFWARQAERLHWIRRWDKVLEQDFPKGHHAWFLGGKLNVSYNCLDRHLDGPRADAVALLWEGDDPKESKTLTYRQLHGEVCRFANVLKRRGVKKGDRVTIYLPMILELPIAMLACARIGAIHSVVFGGFSPDSLRDRIHDCESVFVITADEGLRGGRKIPLKANTDEAVSQSPNVRICIVVRHTGGRVNWIQGRDLWWHEEMAAPGITAECPPEPMDAEDPLFILYTSGSTGKPKGVLHTTGGYLVYVAFSHELVFDHRPGDIFWCTADIGWVTGHSYIVYGPLANAATSVMFEGVPNYPDAGRFWDVVDKHQVNVIYTAPTAIRALMREGDQPVTSRRRTSLRLLGTVGEPINPEAWLWYHRVVGNSRLPIVDTWWQTETGGILITPLPGCTKLKPGSATRPFFGIRPVIVDDQGQRLEGEARGNLCIEAPWPGLMRRVYGDEQRFFNTYFIQFPGLYFTGDGARRDADGYYWITGRVDDVINVSGHRMGTAEVESALVAHPSVAEAAVVGMPHEIKGQGIYAYVTLKLGVQESEALRKELTQYVRQHISAIAAPDVIQWAPGLPKTRSGKIMRRILRRIAADEIEALGDTTTLADPSVVQQLVEHRAVRAK